MGSIPTHSRHPRSAKAAARVAAVLLAASLGVSSPARAAGDGGGKKSPGWAGFSSAVFPGLGQLYNERVWKAACVFGFQSWLILGAFSEERQAEHAFQRAEAATTEGEYEVWAADTRLHEDRKGEFLFWSFLTATLSILDAYVDAHLYGFDEGKDEGVYRLSLGPLPAAGAFPGGPSSPTVGVGIAVRF